jgi:hypothetical protein
MTLPGEYVAKNGTVIERIKVLLWGAGFPWGLAAIVALLLGIYKGVWSK